MSDGIPTPITNERPSGRTLRILYEASSKTRRKRLRLGVPGFALFWSAMAIIWHAWAQAHGN